MKYYAVIDTNVLFSAMLKCDSVPGNIMELVYNGQIRDMLILIVTGKD
jgi:predicted nucleic acid-binding protein